MATQQVVERVLPSAMQSERLARPVAAGSEPPARSAAAAPVVQPKLRVGASTDPAELAADAAAAAVVKRLSSAPAANESSVRPEQAVPARSDPVGAADAAAYDVVARLRSAGGEAGGDLDPDTTDRIERSRGRGAEWR